MSNAPSATIGQLEGGLLASHRYAVLDLASFKKPGLPATLSRVPLEYFAKALTGLSRQPQVDPRQIDTDGYSRDSEAALLLGVYYPRLVHGVIATSHSNVASCSYPGCDDPAWTLHNQPIPFTHLVHEPHPNDNPATVIPVERIHGPIFLVCGGSDLVWTSRACARAIMARLHTHHDRFPHILHAYPADGHGVGSLVPHEPVVRSALVSELERLGKLREDGVLSDEEFVAAKAKLLAISSPDVGDEASDASVVDLPTAPVGYEANDGASAGILYSRDSGTQRTWRLSIHSLSGKPVGLRQDPVVGVAGL